MMPASARFYTPTGQLQFDTNLAAWCLMDKGSFQIGSVTYTNAAGVAPLIAWRAIGCNAAHTKTTRSGDTWTYHFEVFDGETGFRIDWWIFDDAGSVGYAVIPGRPVLRILNDAGDRVLFHSSRPPMRVISLNPLIDNPSGSTVKTVIPATPGKQTAVVGQGVFWQQQVDVLVDSLGNTTGQIVIDTMNGGLQQQAGGEWTAAMYDTASQYGDNDGSGAMGPTILIDVTNV